MPINSIVIANYVNLTTDTLNKLISEYDSQIRINESFQTPSAIIKDKREEIGYALQIKLWENTDQLIVSDSIFLKTARWFWQQSHIENYYVLSLKAFEQFFSTTFSGIDPETIMSMGVALIPEIDLYSGFVYWLERSGVSVEAYIDSNLPHHFFAYYISDVEIITKTYDMLFTLGGTQYIAELKKTPSKLRGFTNTPQDGKLISYSLCADKVRHDTTIEIIEDLRYVESKLPGDLTAKFIHHAPALFLIFEWKFIEALNFHLTTHTELIRTIILSTARDHFFMLFENALLSHHDSAQKLVLLHPLIEKYFWLEHTMISLNTKKQLLLRYPVLIYSMPLSSRNLSGFNEDFLEKLVAPHYKTIGHLPHLCTFAVNIKNFLGNDSSALQKLYQAIFSILIQHSANLNNDILISVFKIVDKLGSLCEAHWKASTEKVTDTITAFCNGTGDIATCETTWGEHLSAINLITHLLPSHIFFLFNNFPTSKYHLYQSIVEHIALIANDKEALVQKFLDHFTSDVSLKTRVLQELLLLTKKQICG